MFNIIDGRAHSALLKSYPTVPGEVIKEGEWVVFNNDGTVSKQVGAYDGAKKAFVVIGGNDRRFDSKALGVITICLGILHGETDVIQPVTINAGERLTLLDGKLTKATAAADAKTIVAECTKPNVNGEVEFVVRQ